MSTSVLQKKLERDRLEAACAQQVEDLHRLFVQWFRGSQPLEVLQKELEDRLSDSFSHVAPNGQFLTGRHVLLGHLQDKYGCYHDRVFEIDIYNVRLVWTDGTKQLLTYEEWQSWQQDEDLETTGGAQQFGRLSTCLLEKPPQKQKPFRWIHVHETWLEDEAPSPTAVRASTARQLLAAAGGDEEDDDTVMTGPVQPDEYGGGGSSNKNTAPLKDLHNKKEEVNFNKNNMASAIATRRNTNDDDDSADESATAGSSKKSNPFLSALLSTSTKSSSSNTKRDIHIPTKSMQEAEPSEITTSHYDDTTASGKNDDSSSSDNEEMEIKPPPLCGEDVLEFEPDGDDESNLLAGAGKGGGSDSDSDNEGGNKLRADDLDPQERAFMEASKGILLWEDEEEALVPPPPPKLYGISENAAAGDELFRQTSMVDQVRGSGPGLSASSNYNNNNGSLTAAATRPTDTPIPNDVSKKRHVSIRLDKYAKPMMWEGVLVGISIAGFDIGTSQGPIADEQWYKEQGARLEEIAQSRSIPRPRRRMCLPEMVYPIAHVALEGNGVWMCWDATDALQCWAECHSWIAVLSRIPWQGVNVLKSNDAKIWETKRKHSSVDESASAVFHYDWTYSTPYCGTMEGGEWIELDESGMRMELLTDKSVPILFFDEIVLFEDDLHDNGQVQYSVKLRIMPSCAYILARLYVRVDHVIIRLRETRLLVDFFGIKPQIYRDVTWTECAWENLEKLGLPTEVRPWHHTGTDSSAWHALVKRLPEVDPPETIFKHAVLEYSGK